MFRQEISPSKYFIMTDSQDTFLLSPFSTGLISYFRQNSSPPTFPVRSADVCPQVFNLLWRVQGSAWLWPKMIISPRTVKFIISWALLTIWVSSALPLEDVGLARVGMEWPKCRLTHLATRILGSCTPSVGAEHTQGGWHLSRQTPTYPSWGCANIFQQLIIKINGDEF